MSAHCLPVSLASLTAHACLPTCRADPCPTGLCLENRQCAPGRVDWDHSEQKRPCLVVSVSLSSLSCTRPTLLLMLLLRPCADVLCGKCLEGYTEWSECCLVLCSSS